MRFLRQVMGAMIVGWLATHAVAESVISGPDQLQVDAYTAVVHGDQARDRGEGKNAVRYYRDAEAFYQQLAVDHPQWHPDIVRYRLTYCANEIAAIVGKSGLAEAEFLAAPEEEPPVAAQANDPRVEELTSENDALRAEMARLSRLIQSRPASAAPDAEVQRLKDEIAGLQAQLAKVPPTGKERLESLNAENAKLGAELEKARKHAAALRETVDLQEKELETVDELRARADALKVEKDRLYAEMKKARDELDRVLQENRVKKLEALVANLRAEVKAARDEEDGLREKLATLEKENAGLKRK